MASQDEGITFFLDTIREEAANLRQISCVAFLDGLAESFFVEFEFDGPRFDVHDDALHQQLQLVPGNLAQVDHIRRLSCRIGSRSVSGLSRNQSSKAIKEEGTSTI